MTWLGIEPSLPALVVHGQPTVLLQPIGYCCVKCMVHHQ